MNFKNVEIEFYDGEISNEMVKNSRSIDEVFPDFVNFIGDNILVGYNCATFDSKFIRKAEEKCNLEINNKYKGTVSCGEVGIRIKENNLVLPCGIYGRWEENE